MKQKINIFIQISLIFLAYGQYIFTAESIELEKIAKEREETQEEKMSIANIILYNVTELSSPFYRLTQEIESYILRLYTSDDPFNFKKKEVVNLIDGSNIESVYKEGSLRFISDIRPDTLDKTDQESFKLATELAENMVIWVSELLWKFTEYIKFLNTTSEVEKSNKKLSVNHFNATVQAILSMKEVIDNLYVWLQDEFGTGVKLIDNLTESIAKQNQMLSTLKISLYYIYKAEQEAGNKITILYDALDPLGIGVSTSWRSKPQDDLLAVIPSRFEETWVERLKRIATTGGSLNF